MRTEEKFEVEDVKKLGEQIGYGHLMSLASALWRKSLKEKGYPESGAFVPTIIQFIEPELAQIPEVECKRYDYFIKTYDQPC